MYRVPRGGNEVARVAIGAMEFSSSAAEPRAAEQQDISGIVLFGSLSGLTRSRILYTQQDDTRKHSCNDFGGQLRWGKTNVLVRGEG